LLKREFLALAAVVAVFVAGGTALMQSGLLPEERAQDFRSLESISLQSEIQVIQEPTGADNTYIYAINDVARQSWEIAKADAGVMEILNGIRGTAVTVAAVQPSAFVSPDGRVTHSGQGQVIITANWQLVDSRLYAGTSFASLEGRAGEAHQKIWNVQVDLDRQKVISIVAEQERVIRETLVTNLVYSGMNMYLPDVVEARPGATVRWINESSVPHNVVGTYATVSGETKIDSGFFGAGESWAYTFSEEGVFDYHCTIHSEEGMKGRLAVRA
jgi:plastocyanin